MSPGVKADNEVKDFEFEPSLNIPQDSDLLVAYATTEGQITLLLKYVT